MKYNDTEKTCSSGAFMHRGRKTWKSGEIKGAVKRGRSWMIPEDVENRQYENAGLNGSFRPLPVGISDFRLAVSDYNYVDKTLLIRDFLDNRPMVSLFTRPRRFGKTLSMDMLRVFFEKSQEDTSVYFKDKLIWQCGEKYRSYQGKYPVIFLTFKDVKCTNVEDTMKYIHSLIATEYNRHRELSESDMLSTYEKQQYEKTAAGMADHIEDQMALQILSQLLHEHHGVKPIIIIDEYDTPIQQGHSCGYYDEVICFMRNFFSGGLNDNPHLAYGFLTGIFQVAKESIFSGLNNLKINSVLDDAYSQYFGFTESEVQQMLEYYGCSDRYDEVCQWYDGYQFGNTRIFNPWSVISYISDHCEPKAFWQSTGSNDFIAEIISSSTPQLKEELYTLLNGEAITCYIDTGVVYSQIQNNPYLIYSFLLMSGYLCVLKVYPQYDGNYMCDVAIPNKEIAYVYEKEVLNQFKQNHTATSVTQAVFTGDTEKLQMLLNRFMLESVSGFDVANESFYHGMMLGLCAVT